VALAYTGDTDECEALLPLMSGASLVLADSSFVEGRDTIGGIHMNGAQCAQVATRAGGVGRLMLTHIPSWNDREECRAQAAAHWDGTVELAEPGSVYILDAGNPASRQVGAGAVPRRRT
jgi:ribonuclease BN (tRNA processing enzyme)